MNKNMENRHRDSIPFWWWFYSYRVHICCFFARKASLLGSRTRVGTRATILDNLATVWKPGGLRHRTSHSHSWSDASVSNNSPYRFGIRTIVNVSRPNLDSTWATAGSFIYGQSIYSASNLGINWIQKLKWNLLALLFCLARQMFRHADLLRELFKKLTSYKFVPARIVGDFDPVDLQVTLR